jgi:uncharacterized delta-60 repeat protein
MLLLVVVGYLICASRSRADGGDLDTIAFSADSYDVTETDGDAKIKVKRVGGADNQVVAKVTLTDVKTGPSDYRFTPGARDATFNSRGSGANGAVHAVTVQPDGNIIIAGQFTSYNGKETTHNVMRLNPFGARDETYNRKGTGADNVIDAMAMQPDGKVIIGGAFTSYNGDASYFVTRLTNEGTRDTGFNPPNLGFYVRTVAVQPDGKIIISGSYRYELARLNADGTQDSTFKPEGSGVWDVPFNLVNAVVVQPNRKIVLGGIFYSVDFPGGLGIMRLNADGTRDTTIDDIQGQVYAMTMQPDGTIIAGGDLYTCKGGPIGCTQGVIRLNPDARLDTTFNPGGTETYCPGLPKAVAVQPDGKIIINLYYDGRVMRLNPDGTLDATFNLGSGLDGAVCAIAVQPDGKIIVGGGFNSYNDDPAANDDVIRLDGDLFVTWPAGDAAEKTIQLPIINDATLEGDETLKLTLKVMSGGATLGSPNWSILIIHDPSSPTINSGGPGACCQAQPSL